MHKAIIVLVAIVVIITGATIGVYDSQDRTTKNLQKQQTVLRQELNSLQDQYRVAKAAANVPTAGWKKFCDQFAPLCFNYPISWSVTDNSFTLPGDDREFASVTNPSKTIHISYDNPLIKDGGSLSVRIVRVSHITVGGTRLAVLGIIPVSSGIYYPAYEILDTDQALGASPSDKAVLLEGSINPRFSVGKYESILLSGGPTIEITSYTQAQAWFDSIDGKITLKILESFATS